MGAHRGRRAGSLKGEVRSGMKGLSPKQKQVLEILESAVRAGEHLTVREIGDRIGVSSTCTVHQHLKALERKGYLKPTNHKHRSIELTSPPRPFVNVPFCGQATAGGDTGLLPITADSMLLPTDLIGQGESVMFQVQGDELADASICDGDLVVVRPGEESIEGDVVVATVQGQAVIKRLARSNGHAPLQIESVDLTAALAADSQTVVGRVAFLLRRL